jgi:hypothetical protein
VASTIHMKIKFPVGGKVGVVQGDQRVSRDLYVQAVKQGGRKEPSSAPKKVKEAPQEKAAP